MESEINITELYERYYDRLLRFAGSLARDDSMAEDLVQETFTRAVSNLELLGMLPAYKVRSWLFSVLKNHFLDLARRKRFEFHEDETEISVNESLSMSMDLSDLLACLPDSLSDIVFKRYWLGMNSFEIAGSLSIPPSTARSRLKTALGILKKKIKREDICYEKDY